MAKIQLSQRMYSILDITRLLTSGELSIQPKYQRRRTAWPVNAKTALMDTILNNFPLPPIYLRDYVDSDGKRKKEIIDGQQRISTIVEFYKNLFALSKNIFDEEFYGCTFSELPTEEQLMIEDFEVSFISIRGASDGDIISIFSRLNSFSLPLNSQEKMNSVYAGEIKTLIYELASEYNTFWIDFKILTPSIIARMADASLVSDILHTIIYGIQRANTKLIDNMYREYDNEFPLKNQISDNFNRTMSVLGNLFESSHIRNVFKPKFMFYSLFLVVYARIFGFNGQENEKTGSIDLDETLRKMEEFCVQYIQPNFNPTLKANFKLSTGNVAQRRFRHEVIAQLVV
ncbi:DUF262 domain-containing protein [Methylobacter sp.]|uniref:DUF262 domain-containing protein n=1 Tax=Methylobacter sp. TaxID=2051955 RepID=UPI002488EBCB|nr:DUF262 domain-containing protein [Methylobacter sp.]MDI1277200.1 DUF262 domain-containing protein [Methylobacter sp.]MDI1357810.1 DUF262 domain-containing protein [Methylobacter sp.]